MHSKDNWSEDIINQVWAKAKKISAEDEKNGFRQDLAGAWIKRDKYGKTDDELGYGWEIDHRVPESKGGSSDISNLRPLQWFNNRSKGDDYPKWSSAISSVGGKNVRKSKGWVIEN